MSLLRMVAVIALAGCSPRAFAQQGGNGSVLSHEDSNSESDNSNSGTVRVPASVMEELNVSKADAVTPEEARRAKVSGPVVVAITISREGRVVRGNAISGQVLLRNAAVESVLRWTYKPYQLNGKAVSVQTTATVVFYPPK